MKNKFVKVTWLDAKKGTDESLRSVLNKSIEELAVIRNTYGILIKDNKDGVVLMHDIDGDDNIEYDVIPNGMIKKIKIL